MTTKHLNSIDDAPNDAPPLVGPGHLLASARKKLGWTTEQVAARLRLRATLIIAIEADQFDGRVSPTFTRGYLRSYAKLVDIPETTIIEAYERLGLIQAENIDMQTFSRRARQETHNGRLKMVTWLLVLILIALIVGWWWQSTALRSAGKQTLAVSEIGQPSELLHNDPQLDDERMLLPDVVNPITSDGDEIIVEEEGDIVPASSDVVIVAPSSESLPSLDVAGNSTTTEVAQTATPQFRANFISDCWLEVRDADNRLLFSGLKKTGDELTLEGREPLKLVVGAPMAVKIMHQGRAIDLSAFNHGRAARFTLPLE